MLRSTAIMRITLAGTGVMLSGLGSSTFAAPAESVKKNQAPESRTFSWAEKGSKCIGFVGAVTGFAGGMISIDGPPAPLVTSAALGLLGAAAGGVAGAAAGFTVDKAEQAWNSRKP